MIREATAADVGQLVTLGQRFHAETPYAQHLGANPAQMARFAESLIAGDQSVIFVADLGGVLVGMFAMSVYLHPLSGECCASEFFWWVEPEHRGIGVRLLRQAERWAKDRGAVVLQLVAPTKDVELLYQRLGLTQTEVQYQKRYDA